MKRALSGLVLAAAAAAAGCSGSTSPNPDGTGGSTGGTSTGGTSTGGARATGGAAPTGGAGGTGGVAATGGKNATGGNATGGTAGGSNTGGQAGASATGGSNGGRGGGTSGGGRGGAGTGGATGGSPATGGSGPDIVAATPPMGWNSWNNFGCNPSESLIKSTADAIVSSGMAAAGYVYVNIDDCWMNGRDSSGNLQVDKAKFPNGIAPLADYVHGKGLKLGIYESPGNTTCAGKTGTQGHETQDAQNYAKWGVDYLKYDLCSGQRSGFAKMRDALKATNRPIVYSINPVYGKGSCIAQGVCDTQLGGCPCDIDSYKIANLWRIAFDINASWGSVTEIIDIDARLNLDKYASPGHWNDPDMLEVGRGMSTDEDKSHFGMWAMLAAPLITGNDVTKMSETTKSILTNKDVIAVDQDPLGKQGTLVAKPGTDLQIWSKELSGTNTRAVALFNRSGGAASITVKWTDIGLTAGSASVRDLYAQKDLGDFTDSYKADNIPKHGIVMLKVVKAP